MINWRQRLAVVTLPLFFGGCAHVQPGAGFTDVEQLLGARLDKQVRWYQGVDEDTEVDAALDRLLAGAVSADAAVQIALLNNRRLQATYEVLGITQAELVQAGLLENPVFLGSAIRPHGDGSPTVLDLSIAQNFLNILMRPARKRLAAAQFEQAKLQVGHAVLELVTAVELAYYERVGAHQVVAMRRLIVEAAGASLEMARRLREAGNASELAYANERNLFEAARIELARSEAALVEAREQLTQLMGLWGKRVAFEVPEKLPDIPAEELPLDGLEALAVQHRLDLAAAGREVEILAAALGISRNWRWIAVAEIGIDAERELDGRWLYGPEVAIEIPVFDQRQAKLARLAAQLRQSEQRLAALAVEIRSEVRRHRDHLLMTRDLIVHYSSVVIPLRERIVELNQQEYNFMLRGVFELLLAKRDEYDAYQEYIEAVRDYWQTRAKLQRAVGHALTGGLPGPETEGGSGYTSDGAHHKEKEADHDEST